MIRLGTKKLNQQFKYALKLIPILLFISCTKSKNDIPPEQTVNLAIWGNYLPDEILKNFTLTTGIKVNLTYFTSNEELLTKVQIGNSGIDVAVPSDYMVGIMIKQNLLERIDKNKIKYFPLLSKSLLGQSYDTDNSFSIPYAWTTTGIAVNKDLLTEDIKSWKDLINNKKIKGKLALLDDTREVLAMALKSQGFSANSVDKSELEKARKILIDLKPLVKMFTSDTVEALKNKEVAIAQSYSSDALQARRISKMNIQFITPEEGSTKAIDNLVILKSSKHKEQAFQLIDYIVRPEHNKLIADKIQAGPIFLTKEETKADFTAIYGKSTLNFERIEDQGENNKLFETIWSELKVGT